MPKMNGEACFQRLRQLNPDVRVILNLQKSSQASSPIQYDRAIGLYSRSSVSIRGSFKLNNFCMIRQPPKLDVKTLSATHSFLKRAELPKCF